jgi:tripartite-type tricarboxylate transporter receptor subunit TctC
MRRTELLFAALAFAAMPLPVAAQAPAWPDKSKTIRFIIPYAPGGSTDLLGRTMAQKLSEALGMSVVPDNRAGAGGNVGAEIAAKSLPDGYTIVIAPVSPMAINVSLYAGKMKFNPLTDFEPITLVAKVPLLLVTHPSVPAKNLRELTALARAKPGKLTYGSAGSGSSNHMIGELYKAAAGIDMVHIPYKGGAPALVALMSGDVDMVVAQVPSGAVLIKAGRVRGIAVSGDKRSPALPDVPTMIESGLPGFDATSWYCVVAPAGTPKPVIARLHAELVKALNSPDVRKRLIDEGADVQTTTPEELMAFVRSEIPKWEKAVKLSGAKVD